MNENNDNSSSSSNNNNGDGQQAQSVDKTINRWGGEELNEIYINAIVSRGNHIQRGKQLSTIPHRMSRMTQKVVSVWGAYRLLHPLPVALPIHPGSSRMIHCSDEGHRLFRRPRRPAPTDTEVANASKQPSSRRSCQSTTQEGALLV